MGLGLEVAGLHLGRSIAQQSEAKVRVRVRVRPVRVRVRVRPPWPRHRAAE